MSTPYDAPTGRSNFLPPACPICLDSGERVIETPTSIGLLRENVPCTCASGLLLEAQITEQLTALWAAHPITEDDRG